MALLRYAFLPAYQPGGKKLDLQSATQGLETGSDGERNRQQHRAFVAEVGQGANRNFFRRRPGDVTRSHPTGQRPLKLRGQAGVAGVFPVGVPFGLVRQLQA